MNQPLEFRWHRRPLRKVGSWVTLAPIFGLLIYVVVVFASYNHLVYLSYLMYDILSVNSQPDLKWIFW